MKSKSGLTAQKSDSKREGMYMRNNGMLPMAMVLFIMIIILIVCGQVSSQQAQSPQPAVSKQQPVAGASLLDSRCSVCHSADKAKKAKKDSQGWEKTVTRMMVKGAQLTETEKVVLVDYLAKTYPVK
jgi:mono/diheme cytochrome c family protein